MNQPTSQSQLHPRPSIGVLVFYQGKLLLLKANRKTWREGIHIIPCGKVKYGERVENAVRREVEEETGLELGRLEFSHYDESIALADYLANKQGNYVCLQF